MRLKGVALCSLLILNASFDAAAAQLTINNGDDLNFNSDQNFSDNTTGFGGVIFSAGGNASITTSADIFANNNSSFGLIVYNSSNLTINGNGSNTLDANENNSSNINLTGSGSTLNINNMNVEGSDSKNGSGVNASSGGKINITGDVGGMNVLKANGNGIAGIFATQSGSEVNISNMSVETNNSSGSHGVSSIFGGKIRITGIANGSNSLTAIGNASDGIYSSSELYIENMNIVANSNGGTGIYSSSGVLNITGVANGSNTLTANGNASGIQAVSPGQGVNIANMNIEVSNNNFRGLASQLGGKLSVAGVADGSNTLTVRNNGIYGIHALGVNSQIDITNMQILGSGNTIFSATNGGLVNLYNSSVVIEDGSKLLEIGSGVGNFTATDSSLMGEMTVASGATSHVTLNNTSWSNIGTSNIRNYVGNDAEIYMNVFFGTGGTSDKLIIDGTSAGNTTLFVASTGTNGNSSEILLVDQSAASSAAANFTLYGMVVDSGVFEYELFQGSQDGNPTSIDNFYLRSNGRATNIANVIANVPAVNLHIAKTGMNELRKRMGELRDNNPEHKSGVWARTYAKNLEVDESIDSKMNIYGFETGYDYQIYGDCDDKIYAGIMAGYSYTDNIRTRNTRGMNGSGHANTPTIGAYATWMNVDGWFADATLRSFWTNMDMTSYTAQGVPVVFDVDRQFTAGSIEAGRQLAWDIDAYSKWILEPKAEFSYIYAKSKSFNTKSDTFGNRIHYGSTDSVQARAALMAGYNTELENGSIIQPFVQAAIIQEFGGVTDINFAGTDYKSDISGTSYEIGTGLNARIDDNWSFYGDVMYEFGNVIQALSTNIGVRYNF